VERDTTRGGAVVAAVRAEFPMSWAEFYVPFGLCVLSLIECRHCKSLKTVWVSVFKSYFIHCVWCPVCL